MKKYGQIHLKVFKKILIGGLSKEELLKRLSHKNIKFNEYARILFENDKFNPPKKNQKVILTKVKLDELGLEENCTDKEFMNRIRELGLELCPLYLAAFLRLEYMDQEDDSYLTVASIKPEAAENYPNGFYLRKTGNELWLRGYRADGFEGWPSSNEFVFLFGARRLSQ